MSNKNKNRGSLSTIIHIAIGNLWEHKSKTIILGLLICIGVMIIVLGNSFLESTKRSLERDFKEHYTADIVIHGPKPAKGTISLFGVSSMVNVGMPPKLPALSDPDAISNIVTEIIPDAKQTKLITCMIQLKPENLSDDFEPDEDKENKLPYGYAFAGEESTYFDIFNEVKITEGNYPQKNEPSILVDNRLKKSYEEYYKSSIALGDTLLVTDLYTGTTIRETKVCGFFDQPNKDTAMMNMVYMDSSTARAFADLTLGSVLQGDIAEIAEVIPEFSSDEEMFFEDDFFSVDEQETTNEEIDFDSLLGDTSLRDELNKTDDGAWNFLVLRLDGKNVQKQIDELNAHFAQQGINATAMDWSQAASDFVSVSGMLSGIFSLLVTILAVVVFIVIMNTLIVSIIERTSEIGTMRALGASRGFVKKLFYAESATITLIASLAGVILALIISAILNACHITIANEAAKVFLGGGSLGFIPTFGSIIQTVVIILIGSLLANIYPVSVALKITPLKAMNS